MKFKKGVSGNPKGRGAEKNHQKRVAENLLSPHAKEAADEVLEQLRCHDGDNSFLQRQWAAKIIIEYSCMKPAQAMEVSGQEGGPITIKIVDV